MHVRPRYYLVLSIVVVACIRTYAIPIDNGLADIDGQPGLPRIDCASDGVRVSIETKNRFEGNIFVKGHFDDPNCRKPADDAFATKHINLTIKSSECGMQRERQAEPLGLFYQAIVVVSFHPVFITKVDRAFKVRCFFMQEAKLFTNLLDVSMLTTNSLLGGSSELASPICTYSIRRDKHANSSESNEDSSVRFALIGEPLFHTWLCTTSTDRNMQNVLIKNCKVEDGNGAEVAVLDSKGCTTDKHIMQTPIYSYVNDHAVATVVAETHAFSFADKSSLYFSCEISICMQQGADEENSADENEECQFVSPPVCGRKSESLETTSSAKATRATTKTSKETVSKTSKNISAVLVTAETKVASAKSVSTASTTPSSKETAAANQRNTSSSRTLRTTRTRTSKESTSTTEIGPSFARPNKTSSTGLPSLSSSQTAPGNRSTAGSNKGSAATTAATAALEIDENSSTGQPTSRPEIAGYDFAPLEDTLLSALTRNRNLSTSYPSTPKASSLLRGTSKGNKSSSTKPTTASSLLSNEAVSEDEAFYSNPLDESDRLLAVNERGFPIPFPASFHVNDELVQQQAQSLARLERRLKPRKHSAIRTAKDNARLGMELNAHSKLSVLDLETSQADLNTFLRDSEHYESYDSRTSSNNALSNQSTTQHNTLADSNDDEQQPGISKDRKHCISFAGIALCTVLVFLITVALSMIGAEYCLAKRRRSRPAHQLLCNQIN